MPFASSAVISYYTIFSLPGLLVVIINVAGYFLGKEAVTNQLTAELGGLIGQDAAQFHPERSGEGQYDKRFMDSICAWALPPFSSAPQGYL